MIPEAGIENGLPHAASAADRAAALVRRRVARRWPFCSARALAAAALLALSGALAFGVEGTRGEPANDDPPEHGLAFRATLRW